MDIIVSHSARKLKTDSRPPGQKLTLHYSIGNKVVCQTEHRLTAETRFIEIPIPVIHRMARGTMK